MFVLFGHGLAACVRTAFIFGRGRSAGSESLTIIGVLAWVPIRPGRYTGFGPFLRLDGIGLFPMPLALRSCTTLFDMRSIGLADDLRFTEYRAVPIGYIVRLSGTESER